jgi:hypothetical protein
MIRENIGMEIRPRTILTTLAIPYFELSLTTSKMGVFEDLSAELSIDST